jgi:hypothetical protein
MLYQDGFNLCHISVINLDKFYFFSNFLKNKLNKLFSCELAHWFDNQCELFYLLNVSFKEFFINKNHCCQHTSNKSKIILKVYICFVKEDDSTRNISSVTQDSTVSHIISRDHLHILRWEIRKSISHSGH